MMGRKTNNKFKTFALVALICIVLTGCQASGWIRNTFPIVPKGGLSTYVNQTGKTTVQVSDRDVLEFTNQLIENLRDRTHGRRIARKGAIALQVIASAIAGGLSAAEVAKDAVTGLSTFSAVMPELQSVFQAGEEAAAFGDALGLVEEARVRFFSATSGLASHTSLTPAGAELASEVFSSIKALEKTLVGRIPTLQDLEKASGKARKIVLDRNDVSVKPGATAGVLLVSGGPISGAISVSPATATVSYSNKSITLTGVSAGTTTIKLLSTANAITEINVQVIP